MFATKNMMKNMAKKSMGMPEHLTNMGGGKLKWLYLNQKLYKNYKD